MMKYDFSTILDRKGKDALAVDSVGKLPGFSPDAPDPEFDLIPMWVADMNFATVPTVQEKIRERVDHPAFGYFDPRDEYYDLIIRWQSRQNGVTGLEKKHIGYENGVLGGVVSAMNSVCSRGDNILVHSPTYIGFTSSLEANGYHLVTSPLVQDEEGVWRMDYADMEKKIRENRIHAAILCSPHNPCGRVWTEEELKSALEIYERNDVFVVSDEIWSDLILNGNHFIPTQSVNDWAKEHVAAFYAPSKTFNLAGLIGSYHIIYNDWWRDRIERESSLCHYNSMNVLSMYGLIGAYQEEGYEWLNELREVLKQNVDYACDYIDFRLIGAECAKPEATYMLFLDCSRWCMAHGKTIEELEKRCWKVGVAVQDGVMFHGPCHIRMNLALPMSRIREAFDRLDRYVFNADW